MFEIDKTRKHFVPKFYLRGFCPDNRPEQIYVFDKDNPQAEVAVRSIEKVEVSRDAYSVANDGVLQEREDQWAEILRTLKGQRASELNELIADREKSATLRAWLARFVVDSKLRSRGLREQMREPVKEMRLRFGEEIEAIEADFRARFPDLSEQLQDMVSLRWLALIAIGSLKRSAWPPFCGERKGRSDIGGMKRAVGGSTKPLMVGNSSRLISPRIPCC